MARSRCSMTAARLLHFSEPISTTLSGSPWVKNVSYIMLYFPTNSNAQAEATVGMSTSKKRCDVTDFTIHHFLFTVEVVTPIELDEHSGSALRGSFFEAVWRRFCTNKASSTCVECPLHTVCPVSALVAPLREENSRGRDIPRPSVIIPPQGQERRFEGGSQVSFGLT